MQIISAQYNKLSGPDLTSSFKLEFTIDESQSVCLKPFLDLKKGTSVILLMFDYEKDEQEINEFKDETADQTKERMFKRMHALINKVAKDKNIAPSEIKKVLKEFLIKKKCIKTSSKELDIKGLATAIYFLSTEYNN